MSNFSDSFPSPRVELVSDSKLSATGSSIITVFGNAFSVAHYSSKVRVDITACLSTDWMSDSAIHGKSMSQVVAFSRRSVFVSLALRPSIFSSSTFFTYHALHISQMNVRNKTHASLMQNGTLVSVESAFNVSLSCENSMLSCTNDTTILSLSTSQVGSISPLSVGLNLSIELSKNQPVVPCVEYIWSSDSSLHCRLDKLPEDWSVIAFPTFRFQTLSSPSIFATSVRNDYYNQQVITNIADSLHIKVTTNSTARSHEIFAVSIEVENNSSLPFLNPNGYVGVNVVLTKVSITGSASITAEKPRSSIFLAENTLRSIGQISIVMASLSAGDVVVPLTFSFIWYATSSPSAETVVTVQKHVTISANAVQTPRFIEDVPSNAVVVVNYGWLTQSPTPEVEFPFSLPCDSFNPLLTVNVSLSCAEVSNQVFVLELNSDSCSSDSNNLTLQVQREWFKSPPIPTTCCFKFSIHNSLNQNPISSRVFNIAVGPPVFVHLLGNLPSYSLRSGDPLFTVNSTTGSCIVAYFRDASGFKVTSSGIAASLSAKTFSMGDYVLGLQGNHSLVVKTDGNGALIWCGILAKLIVPSAFLQIMWDSEGQSYSSPLGNATFSVNSSGLQALSTLVLTSRNISVLPGQGVPPMNLTLTDAAGNAYMPLSNTYIRVTIIPSVSSRRRLLADAETSATCESGGPKYVPVSSSVVAIDGSVIFACTAGTSVVQYDVGLVASGNVLNNALINGTFGVVSPAVVTFSISVFRGPAVSFRFVHRNSTEFVTFTTIQNAFFVLCRDSGRNVRCMYHFCEVFILTQRCRLSVVILRSASMLQASCQFHFCRRL